MIDQLNQYVTDLFATEDDVLKWIQAEAARQELPTISIKPFEGRLLQFLVTSVGARKVVEIGSLAGYSAVWIGRALPPDGKMFTLEKSSKHVQVTRASLARAGLSDRVEVLEGSAMDSLKKLAAQAPFDFVFIDADRASARDYLAWAVEQLRVGGMVATHNAFRAGRVLAPENEDDRLMQAYNQALAANTQLFSTILAIGDGMSVGIKRG